MLANCSGPFPVLVRIAASPLLVVPEVVRGKLSEPGLKDTPGVRIPLPRKLTVKEGFPGASVRIFNTPGRGPTAVGAKWRVKLQFAPPASRAGGTGQSFVYA